MSGHNATPGYEARQTEICPKARHPTEDLARIKDLLLCARDLWRAFPEIDDDADKIRAVRQTFRLIHLADILSVPPGV